jgi:DNA-binding NarL/FixJ family response regulator
MSELELVRMIAAGLASKEIAIESKHAETTIESYRSRLLRKYQVRNAAQLVAHFYETGKLASHELTKYSTLSRVDIS